MLRSLTFLMLLFALVACQSMDVQAGEDTGVQGKVFWGPVKPGPTSPGKSDEAPLAASFTVYSGDIEVATFQSDKMGSFKLALPPGDYTIVPAANTPIPRPDAQVTRVMVPAKGYVSVTIKLETGMR